MSNIEKAKATLKGLSDGDANLATQYLNPERYLEHAPRVGDGAEGVRQYVTSDPLDERELKVIRAFEDGGYVVTQADGQIKGDGTFFDVFRFEDGLIVEHWGFSAAAGPPNKSGHTQVDGPTEHQRPEDTDANKALVRDYYETVHLAGRHDQIRRFLSADLQIRHEPGVTDGVDAFERDLAVLTSERTIDAIKLLLGQGDFVFIAALGTHRGSQCAYIDLYRVENSKLVEHWGFPEQIPPPDMRKNRNAML
jgi:predicted SnoaL-like aldol condensation-catalyzing enzyme